jgi:hypothetical protein
MYEALRLSPEPTEPDTVENIFCLVYISCLVSVLVPEIGTSSIDWAQLSRLVPEKGDRIRSPKRCFK